MLVSYLLGLIAGIGVWLARFEPWYQRITLPSWSPSTTVLRVGWAAGLATTGLSVWRTVDTDAGLTGLAVGLFWAQLVMAALWSEFFIRRRRARTSFYLICLVWTAAALAAAAAAALDASAGVLAVPWLGFVTYVGAFNFFVWQLENRS